VHHEARDDYLRSCLARCDGLLDIPTIEAAWGQVLAVPRWTGPPVWVHGDLKPGNLLVRDGRLSAVIDFGSLAVGDPASDAAVAWEMFAGESRSAYREALGCDDDTWARGRGWALSVAVIALPYYVTRNRSIAEAADRIIRDVLAEL
jgi:aminoglycoside phosphotransferase (APT) family kinase protein